MWADFFRSALLLALTAALTGLVVPLIIKTVDERKKAAAEAAQEVRLRERMEYEAGVMRQTKVIDAQAAFLDRFADLLWEFQLLVLAVPYYRQFPTRQERFQEAVETYLLSAGELLGRIRAEVSKSLRLTTPDMYDQLHDLYRSKLLQIDLKLVQLIDQDTGSDQLLPWVKFLTQVRDELSVDVDETINSLAVNFGLGLSPARQLNHRSGTSPVT